MRRKNLPDPLITAVSRDFTAESAAEIIDIALRRARWRRDLLDRLTAALIDCDIASALEMVCELRGLNAGPGTRSAA